MLVAHQDDRITHAVIGGKKSIDFGISDDPAFFQILSSALYKDPMLAKVRPEDVIAVPDYDANKMRVCGYHIIAELTPAQYQAINGNRPMSNAEGGMELLGKVIAGDHVGVLEHVKITKQQGEGLEISPQEPSGKAQKKAKTVKPVKALEAAVTATDSPVNVKKVAAKVKDSNVSLIDEPKAAPVTQTDVVKALWDDAIAGNQSKARELIAFKKKAKKGWAVWGLPPTAGDTLKALLDD